MNDWNKLAGDETVQKTLENLKKNGINGIVVENREEAKKKVFEMIPKGDEVMTMTSVTLDEAGISKEINESGDYHSVKAVLNTMNRNTQHFEMQRLGAASKWSIGSVHAVTQKGEIVVASNSGSQLPGYVYGSLKVIFVVGTNKIVKTVDEGIKRIKEHIIPLEAERVKKVYGLPGTFLSKLLVLFREPHPDRITVIFVKEKLGF